MALGRSNAGAAKAVMPQVAPRAAHHCTQGTSTSPLAPIALGPPEILPGFPGPRHTATAHQELTACLQGKAWWERLFSSSYFIPTARVGQDQPPGAPVQAPPCWVGLGQGGSSAMGYIDHLHWIVLGGSFMLGCVGSFLSGCIEVGFSCWITLDHSCCVGSCWVIRIGLRWVIRVGLGHSCWVGSFVLVSAGLVGMGFVGSFTSGRVEVGHLLNSSNTHSDTFQNFCPTNHFQEHPLGSATLGSCCSRGNCSKISWKM